ncbi:atp18 subunit J of the mitochondrial F1F0 ATP synthase [Vanrija albida]|uniref:Atp18 subunit J of the mitochondrial F1F0 ATP synthase n=1 Tax=Vanrija albida TaxID=181172 RepID=A0ABR3PUR4_9TREE
MHAGRALAASAEFDVDNSPYTTIHPSPPSSSCKMFGLRAWPTPFLKPLAPFIFASAVTWFGVNAAQDAAVATPEALKDPKNPYAASILKQQAH